jgi:cob(I)alamin adenosyltransferase
MKKSLVYTKTGDKGTTALVGGTRVPKSHIRLDAYGTIDELNSFVGSLICEIEEEDILKVLSFIQQKLFTVGSYLATETEAISPKAASIITDENIALLEKEMDRMDSELPPIRQFILPGGSESAARAHICRTVARRAERCMYRVKEEYPVEDNIMKFVNRLSDYFFVLSRRCNKSGKEIFWDTSCK